MNGRHEAWMGASLLSVPFWTDALHQLNFFASTGAAVCGLILGAHGIYRTFIRPALRRYRAKRVKE